MVGTMRRLPSGASRGRSAASPRRPAAWRRRPRACRAPRRRPARNARPPRRRCRDRPAHDGGRGTAGGQPGDIDPPRVDRVVAHDLAGDAGDQRGFAPVALLVAGAEPVPAFLRIGSLGLAGIDDQAAMLLGERVHPRAGGEVVGRLGAAVQHDDQRHRLAAMGAGDVELVAAASGLAAEAPGHELGALRQRLGRPRHRALRQPVQALRQATLVDLVEEATQCLRHLRHRAAVPRPPAGQRHAAVVARLGAAGRAPTPRPSRDRRR